MADLDEALVAELMVAREFVHFYGAAGSAMEAR